MAGGSEGHGHLDTGNLFDSHSSLLSGGTLDSSVAGGTEGHGHAPGYRYWFDSHSSTPLSKSLEV